MTMTSPGENYFRDTLAQARDRLTNYGDSEALPCDLSLISGPFIWEDEVRSALGDLPSAGVCAYARPSQDHELRDRLAARENVDRGWIHLTPGADVGLEYVLRQVLGDGDHMAVLCPNFPRFFIVAATLDGVTSSVHTDLESLPTDARLIAVCTPNNPSTEEIPVEALRAAIRKRPGTLFCLDGVFDWYGSYALSDLCREFPNVILLKSFSKIGLAGLRLGYIVAHPDNMALLTAGLSPFAVPALVQVVGLAVARRFDRLAELQERIDDGWRFIRDSLGSAVTRSCPVPFYLLETRVDSDQALGLLAAEGISVVAGSHFEGLRPRVLRVAVGAPEQNVRLVETVRRLELIS